MKRFDRSNKIIFRKRISIEIKIFDDVCRAADILIQRYKVKAQGAANIMIRCTDDFCWQNKNYYPLFIITVGSSLYVLNIKE